MAGSLINQPSFVKDRRLLPWGIFLFEKKFKKMVFISSWAILRREIFIGGPKTTLFRSHIGFWCRLGRTKSISPLLPSSVNLWIFLMGLTPWPSCPSNNLSHTSPTIQISQPNLTKTLIDIKSIVSLPTLISPWSSSPYSPHPPNHKCCPPFKNYFLPQMLTHTSTSP